MGREMTIDEIRGVQVAILDKVHSFCIDNNLRYSLSGGTLLGAVRHKGYIPWDDDIDIMMPRPDYEKLLLDFCGIYKHLIIQDYKTDVSYPLRWLRIYDDRTKLLSLNSEGGVFVDVFPVDGLPNETETLAYLEEYKALMRKLKRVTKRRGTRIHGNRILKDIKYFIKKLILPSRSHVISEFDALFNRYPFETSEFAGAIVGMFGIKEHMHSSVFKSYIELPFEGKNYMCIKQYDAYLTKHYGDYMQLPPEEKRITHHKFKVYWRE